MRYRKRSWAGVLLIIAAVILQGRWNASAAINPMFYRQGHPECSTIRIVVSQLDKSRDVTRVYLTAKVVEVFWTATGLKPDDLILVTYQQDHARVEREEAALEERLRSRR